MARRTGATTRFVSEELVQLLSQDELEGVLVHELAHIANRDVVMMVLGQGIASIVGLVAQYIVIFTGDSDLADFFLGIVVGNIVQMLVMVFVMAISWYREYVADADPRRAIGSGDPLARALEKISSGNQRAGESNIDENVNALCIFGRDMDIARLLSTHPPIETRIARLRN